MIERPHAEEQHTSRLSQTRPSGQANAGNFGRFQQSHHTDTTSQAVNSSAFGDRQTTLSSDLNRAQRSSMRRATSGTSASFPHVGTIIDGQTLHFSAERIIGNGSFGVVFQASVVETGETVAIKKVLQDKRFKNRELHIMRQLAREPHPNVIAHSVNMGERQRTVPKEILGSLQPTST